MKLNDRLTENIIRVSAFFLFALPVLIYSTAFAAVKMQNNADDWLLAKKSSAVSCAPPSQQKKESKKNTMPRPAGQQTGCHFPGSVNLTCERKKI
jgi:hypothetical protein